MEATEENQNAALRALIDETKALIKSLSTISLLDLLFHFGAGTHLSLLSLLESKLHRGLFFTKQLSSASL